MGLLDQYDKAKKYAAGLLAQVPQNAQDMYQGLLSAPSQVSDLFSQQKAQQLAKALKNPQQANPKQWMDAGMNLAGMAPVGGLIGMTKGADGLIGMVDNAPMPSEYGIAHRPPMRDSGAPLHDLTGGGTVYPDDIYSPNASLYYGHFGGNHPMDTQTMSIIQRMRGNPNGDVTIYRAIPTAPGNMPSINPGDWVTINRNYAKDHGESALNGEYKILSKKVKAKDIFTNGDSVHEFGYDPSK